MILERLNRLPFSIAFSSICVWVVVFVSYSRRSGVIACRAKTSFVSGPSAPCRVPVGCPSVVRSVDLGPAEKGTYTSCATACLGGACGTNVGGPLASSNADSSTVQHDAMIRLLPPSIAVLRGWRSRRANPESVARSFLFSLRVLSIRKRSKRIPYIGEAHAVCMGFRRGFAIGSGAGQRRLA